MKLLLKNTNITVDTNSIDVIEWGTNVISVRGRLISIEPEDTKKLLKLLHPEHSLDSLNRVV